MLPTDAAACTGEERLKEDDGLHPTQKPEALPPASFSQLARRRPGARPVLRHRHHRRGYTGRRFVGFERTTYIKAAEKRIAEVKPLEAPTLAPFMTARRAARAVRRADRARPDQSGRQAGRRQKRHIALVRADGAVAPCAPTARASNDKVGSIHRIGAVAQGLDACNGWTFWHLETPKGLTLIDELRAKIRAEMADA